MDDKAQRLLVSFYHLSADNPSDIFNYTLARASKNELLNLIVQIKQRLSVINDGSFKVVDEETSVIEKW